MVYLYLSEVITFLKKQTSNQHETHGDGPLLTWRYVFAPSQFNTTLDPSHWERKTLAAHTGLILPLQSVGFFSCDSSWWRHGPGAKESVGPTGFHEHIWTCTAPPGVLMLTPKGTTRFSYQWTGAELPHFLTMDKISFVIYSTFNYHTSRRSIRSLWLGEASQARGNLDGLHAVHLKICIPGARRWLRG